MSTAFFVKTSQNEIAAQFLIKIKTSSQAHFIAHKAQNHINVFVWQKTSSLCSNYYNYKPSAQIGISLLCTLFIYSFFMSLCSRTGSMPKLPWSRPFAYKKELTFLRTFLGISSNPHYFTFHRSLPFCTVSLAVKLFRPENPLDFFCLDSYNVPGMKFSQGKPKPL